MRELLKPSPKEPPQIRLERIWTLLRMSDTAKLDMAIKYSTDEHVASLVPVSFKAVRLNLPKIFFILQFNDEKAIEEWEKATELIVEREKCIFELENFERTASDPNRFFLKGHRGSSAARLEEALIRDNLYKVNKLASFFI